MKKITRKIGVIFFVISILVTKMIPVYAAENGKMTDLDTGKTGTLQVLCKYTDDNKKESLIEGIELTISQVASVKVSDGEAKYELIPDYSTMDIQFQGMTASESNNVAQKLEKYQVEHNLTGDAQTTNVQGVASFTGLPFGIYLIRQTGSTESAKQYDSMESFLAMVPMPEEGNTWSYDVQVSPKIEITKPTTKPTTPPTKTPVSTNKVPVVKTGDNTNVTFWLSLCGVAVLGIICITVLRRKNDTE